MWNISHALSYLILELSKMDNSIIPILQTRKLGLRETMSQRNIEFYQLGCIYLWVTECSTLTGLSKKTISLILETAVRRVQMLT